MEDIISHSISILTTNLLKEIHQDYGDKYKFSLEDLEKYRDTFIIEYEYTETKVKKTPAKKIVDESKKCQARVWGKGYLNIPQYNKYLYAKSFKKDVKFNSTIFGKKCQKNSKDDNIYCQSHINNLPHGDYYLPPPKEVIGYYEFKNRSLIKQYNK